MTSKSADAKRPEIEDIRRSAIRQLTDDTADTAMDHRVPQLCDYTLSLERKLKKLEASRESRNG